MAKRRWPPNSWNRKYDKFKEWAAWLSGNPEELLDIYSAKFSLDKGDYNYIDNGIGYNTLHDIRGRFWGKNIQNERQTMLHVPVAGDIAAVSSDLLFSEKPDITIPDDNEQERLETIITETDFYSRLLELGETLSALGGAYLKVNWDTSFKGFPIISVVQPDHAIPEFKWGFLQKVTFHKRVAIEDTNLIYRLLEIHEPGVIKNQLWRGTRTGLGKQVSLETLESTSGLEPEVNTGLDHLACRYVANKLPNRLWRGSDMGQSDYSGIEGIMDSIDEAYTSWMRDLRLGRARIIVPESMLKTVDGQRRFDIDKEIYESVKWDPNSDAKITPQQFDIRAQQHKDTILELMTQAYSLAGYSPSTFGIDTSGGGNLTATEVKAREAKSYKTRNKKAKHVKKALEDILHTALQIDNIHFGGASGDYRPQVELQDSFQENPLDKSESLYKLKQAEAISIDTKVRMLHKDWSEEQIEEEVDRIKRENGMIVDEPDVRA